LLCVALLDDVHLSFECDALGVTNNANPWMENSQRTENNTGIHVYKLLQEAQLLL